MNNVCTHFIEQINNRGSIVSMPPAKMAMLEWALQTSVKFNTPTVAVFKIYPKPAPMIAHYDYDLKTTIVE